MWTHPLTTALVAVGSSLLTIFLTPWLQHYLWQYQRRAEIRLAAVREFNRLTTEFLAQKLFPLTPHTPDAAAKWFTALNVVSGDVEVLFSPRAMEAVKTVDKMIDAHAPIFRSEDFVVARDAALRALYREVIPIGAWRDRLRQKLGLSSRSVRHSAASH